jgi:hypothetical protein
MLQFTRFSPRIFRAEVLLTFREARVIESPFFERSRSEMVQKIRCAIASRFFAYYFFTEKVIAICDARNRKSVCPML